MGEETTTPPEGQGLSEAEFRKVIGEEFDTRFTALGLDDKLNRLTVLDSIGDDLSTKLTGLFEANKSGGINKESLLGEIGTLIDSKLAGIKTGNPNPSPSTGRKSGPLARWLGFV